jgi:hypothetical protein
VIPVPPAPELPTDWIVANSTFAPESMRITSPAVTPNVKFTLRFVSPGFAATTSVGVKNVDGPLPTEVTVTVSGVPSGSIVSFAPTAMPPVLSALIFVSPALAGAASVVWPPNVSFNSGSAAVVIAGAWLDTSCDARCVGVNRAIRSAARSANV